MVTDQVTPSPQVYRTLMQSMYEDCRRRCKETQESKQMPADELFRLYLVFQEMRIAGVKPDTPAYNTLINACAAAGDLERGLETVKAMQEDGMAPDIITYTSLIKACSINAGAGTTELAEEIFSDMQQRTNHFSTYIAPTELTYQRLMQAHISNNMNTSDMDRVLELLSEMKSRGLEAGMHSVTACRACIQVAVRRKDVSTAMKMLDGIRYFTRAGFDLKSWYAVKALCNECNMFDCEEDLKKEIKDMKERKPFKEKSAFNTF